MQERHDEGRGIAAGCLTKDEWMVLNYQLQHGLTDPDGDALLKLFSTPGFDASRICTSKIRTLKDWARKASDIEHRVYDFKQKGDGDQVCWNFGCEMSNPSSGF